MTEQLLTVLIQILFPLALLKFTVWSMLIRPILRRTRRDRPNPSPHQYRKRERRRRRPRRQRPPWGQPPPPDALEAGYHQISPYAETPLSDELADAIKVLLVLFGALGVDPKAVGSELHGVNLDRYLRAVTRIKLIAERLAETGIEDGDGATNLAVTGYMLELADHLRGLNRMRSFS